MYRYFSDLDYNTPETLHDVVYWWQWYLLTYCCQWNGDHRAPLQCRWYRSFSTTVSQLKICDFSGETFKGFEVLLSAMSATRTQLLSSGELCKLRYDTTPIPLHLQTFLSVPITQKCQILSRTLVANERYVCS